MHTRAERVENKELGLGSTFLQYTTYASSPGACVFGFVYANTKQFDAFGTSSCAKAEQSNEHLQLFIRQKKGKRRRRREALLVAWT